MEKRIFTGVWLVFLGLICVFLLHPSGENDSFHAFFELSSFDGIIHFEQEETEKGLLSFACDLPEVSVERPFLAISTWLPERIELDGKEFSFGGVYETININGRTWFMIPMEGEQGAKRLSVRFHAGFLEEDFVPSTEFELHEVPQICFGSRNVLLNNLAMSSNLHIVAAAVLFFVALVILLVSAVFEYIYKIRTYAFYIGFCFLGFAGWILCESAVALSALNKYSIDILKCISIFIIPVLLFRYISLEFPKTYKWFFIGLSLLHFVLLAAAVAAMMGGYASFYDLEQSMWFLFICSLMECICCLSVEVPENKKMYTLYIGIVIIFFTFFIYLLFYNFQPMVAIRSLVLGSSCLILYNFIAFIPKMAEIYRQSLERKNLEQQLIEQVRQYKIMEAKDSQYRKLRHDMKNHWQVMQVLLAAGRLSEALDYTAGIQSELEFQTRHPILNTGNAFLDAILTSKLEQAVGSGIRVDTEIMVVKDMKIDMIDCGIIFGNVLDNAIEACSRLDGEREIQVKMLYKKGMLVCCFRNSILPDATFDGDFPTSKANPDNHGIGLGNIREAVEKYGGTLNLKAADGCFEVSFVLFGV